MLNNIIDISYIIIEISYSLQTISELFNSDYSY